MHGCVSQRRCTTPSQTKLLTRLSARWNAQLSFAGNGRYFDLCSQGRLGYSDRNDHINVVALAGEMLVATNVRDDEQIAGRRAQSPAFAFAGNSHPRAGIDPRRNAHLDGLCLRNRAFAMTNRARRTPLSGATTVRTFLGETEAPTRSLHLSSSFAGLAGC